MSISSVSCLEGPGGNIEIVGSNLFSYTNGILNIVQIYFSTTNTGSPTPGGTYNGNISITYPPTSEPQTPPSSTSINGLTLNSLLIGDYYVVIEYDDFSYIVSPNTISMNLTLTSSTASLFVGQYIILNRQYSTNLSTYDIDTGNANIKYGVGGVNTSPLTVYSKTSNKIILKTDDTEIQNISGGYIEIIFSQIVDINTTITGTYNSSSNSIYVDVLTYSLGLALVNNFSVTFPITNILNANGTLSIFLTNTIGGTVVQNGNIYNLQTSSETVVGEYYNTINTGDYYYALVLVQDNNENLKLTSYSNSTTNYLGNSSNNNNTPICFKANTKILCLVDNIETEIYIQNLKKGDLVKTLKDGYLPVSVLGKDVCYNPKNKERIISRLYKLTKKNYPSLKEDLVLTGCHSILVDFITNKQIYETEKILGRLCMTSGLFRLLAHIDERSEVYTDEYGDIDVYHVALGSNRHINYGIFANGLLVESCFTNTIERKMKIIR